MKEKKEKDFYDEIANWDFSNIKYKVERKVIWDFYDEIAFYSNETTIALDLGTGGGEKVLKFYPKVKRVVATDLSKNMIKTANENLKKSGRKDVIFKQMDNLKIAFDDETFDVISARHTVINAKELYRALKKGGMIIIQGVDKEDCLSLEKKFGRGQAFKDRKPISQIDYEDLVKAGFKIIKKVRIEEEEYYETKEDLLALLLKTPILDDYSEETNTYKKLPIEENILDEYIKENTTPKGILLNRVLYGIVAQK